MFFNIFICDLFFSTNERDFTSYVNDNTPYVTGTEHIVGAINSVENDSIELFEWFADKQMKAKKDKYHLVISGCENITIKVEENMIKKSSCEKLLHVNLDYKLKFHLPLLSVTF